MLKTRFSTLSSFILLSLYTTSILAANDWSKPCFDGSCSYDLPDDPTGASGTVKIWGSNTAIADITAAGGWEIIGCDPNKEEQEIRIVCKGIDVDGDGDNDGCSHLFADAITSSTMTSLPVPTGTVVDLGDVDEDRRANGKIVRLPQECGKQPFARIASAWTHENQTVPTHISKRLAPLHRRTQHRHKVKGLTIDTQFHKTDRNHGSVNFAIVGANVPGAKASGDSDFGKPGMKRNVVHSRMFTHRRGFGDVVDGVGGAIGDGAGAVGGAIKDGAGAVGGAIKDGAGAVKDAVTGEKHFDKSLSAPLDISKTFTLFEKSIECSEKFGGNESLANPKIGVDGHMKVAVEAGVHGNVHIAVAASGSLTDLRVDTFDLTTTLNADLEGAIIMSAGVGGSIDSGKIKFFEVGIPGFDFPGIFSIGPTFQINGKAKVSLDIDTDMRIGVVYHIDDLQFHFPKGGKRKGSFRAGDTPLQLSAQPSASATGTVEAHLIPSLNVGINAFGGVAKAEVFANLDASASMTLKVDATLPSVQANVTSRDKVIPMMRGRGAIGAYYLDKRSPVPEPFGFGDIVSGIKDGAKKAAGAVKSGAEEAAGAVKSGAEKAAGAVKSGAKKAAGVVESGAKKTASVVKSGAKKVEEGTKKVVESGAKKVEAGAEKVEEGAKKVGGTIEKDAKKVEGAVEAGAKKVEEGAKKVEEGTKKVVESGAKKVEAGAKKVEEGAKKVGGTVEKDAKKVEGAVKSGAKKVEGAVKSGAKKVEGVVEKGAKKVGGAIKEGAKKVGGAVKEGAEKVEEGAKKAGKAIEGGAKKVGGAIEDGAKKVGGAIAAGAKDVKGAVDPPKSSSMTTSKTASSVAPKATVSVAVNDEVKFGGCLEMNAGLVANVGADADFFGLFDPSKTIPLFQKQFSLFKKCFGDQEKRRELRHVGRGLQCNGRNASRVENLANEVVSAARLA